MYKTVSFIFGPVCNGYMEGISMHGQASYFRFKSKQYKRDCMLTTSCASIVATSSIPSISSSMSDDGSGTGSNSSGSESPSPKRIAETYICVNVVI